MHVAIVGAGIVGAACADSLTTAGVHVTLFDRSYCGGGTTAAGMGHLVVMDDSPAQFELTRLSVELWRRLAADLSSDVEYDSCGTLWVADDDEEMAAAEAKVSAYKELGVVAEAVDGARIADLEPSLRSGFAGGMRVPDDAVLYPSNAARALLARATRRGAVITEGRNVARIEPGRLIFADGTSHLADIVLNAAGAEAGNLTPALPIQPRKGHLAITDRCAGTVRHQVLELGYLKSAHSTDRPSVAFNVQPRKTGQVLIGSSREYVGWDESINSELLKLMLRRTLEFMPALGTCQILRVWTGFRPATPDKLPVIGELEPGIWVAAGHEGLGITTCLGTAQLVVDLLLNRKSAIDPTPFSAARFVSAQAPG